MSFFGPQGNAQSGRVAQRFTLQHPVSIAVYDSYEDAQHAVDYLADQRFPVGNLSIVGTDLKSVERITGGLNWGKVIATAVMTGVTWGVLGALFIKLLMPSTSLSLALFGAVSIFIIANLITSSISYAMTGGRRDFTSATQVMATRYEILGEAPVASQARALLSGGAGQGREPRRPSASPEPWTQAGPGQPSTGDPDPSSFPPPAWPPQPAPGPQDPGAQSPSAQNPQWPGPQTPGAQSPGAPQGPREPQAPRTFDPTDRGQG
ncbi:hypothetical protein SAMN05443377_10120 [Propionibacterium cyclohexanicum]|uniref:General stress protein 17M-like domain-containing protein n=1 Tax=Propionibacterium cyclohexanicum TaxID=64702 RepID=A0A1H9PGE4_9ACTN|nr:general stress protein [Propionibacterium cyclohexanicum]SER47228.1 hypothetical protein SAMN05443377_10120 [Propionibacterium cyclohexanicum]